MDGLLSCTVFLYFFDKYLAGLNVPTQGQRVAQTGTKPFSLTALPGSDPQLGIEPGPPGGYSHI